MANPVVHFEIIGKDAAKTQQLYSNLFGWNVDADNPMNYGMVDNGGQGINGGIGGAEAGGKPQAIFYVEVADPQAMLDKASGMGCKVLTPVTEIPGMVTFAMFADPDGNSIGLVKSA